VGRLERQDAVLGFFSDVTRKKSQRFDTQFWAEDANGDTFDLATLMQRSNDTTVIPELSSILVIETEVLQFRFKRRLKYGTYKCCEAGGPESWRSLYDTGNIAIFLEKDEEGSSFTRRIEHEPWDCLVLYEGRGKSHKLMIVDWIGDVAHQVGAVNIEDPPDKFLELPYERRKVRLE
jgi:hypothetical protein